MKELDTIRTNLEAQLRQKQESMREHSRTAHNLATDVLTIKECIDQLHNIEKMISDESGQHKTGSEYYVLSEDAFQVLKYLAERTKYGPPAFIDDIVASLNMNSLYIRGIFEELASKGLCAKHVGVVTVDSYNITIKGEEALNANRVYYKAK